MNDEFYMRKALELAELGANFGEVPVGAIIVLNDEIIGEGFNCSIKNDDPSAHAEVTAIRKACSKICNYRLVGAKLYVTLEPCTMCAGLLIHSRISELVFGTFEPRSGAICSCSQVLAQSFHNHKVQVRFGVLQQECAKILQDFFKRKRSLKTLTKTKLD